VHAPAGGLGLPGSHKMLEGQAARRPLSAGKQVPFFPVDMQTALLKCVYWLRPLRAHAHTHTDTQIHKDTETHTHMQACNLPSTACMHAHTCRWPTCFLPHGCTLPSRAPPFAARPSMTWRLWRTIQMNCASTSLCYPHSWSILQIR